MSNIPNINNGLPYIPASAPKERAPQERVIPSPEKQDISAQNLPQTRNAKETGFLEKKPFEEKKWSDLSPGPELASSKEEPAVETGLVFVEGHLVQEARDPLTGRIMEHHPRVGCEKYEKVSTAMGDELVVEVQQAS